MLPLESWRISFDERFPIYLQIINQFNRSLVKGELQPGERIPSIRDLAVALKVNNNTVQRVYQEMERDKFIYSQRGTGYFVMNDDQMVSKVREEMVHESTSRFLEEMQALGFDKQQILDELSRRLHDKEDSNATAAN